MNPEDSAPPEAVEALELTKRAKLCREKGFPDEEALFLINALDLLNQVVSDDLLTVRVCNQTSRSIQILVPPRGTHPCLNAAIRNIFKLIRVLDVESPRIQEFSIRTSVGARNPFAGLREKQKSERSLSERLETGNKVYNDMTKAFRVARGRKTKGKMLRKCPMCCFKIPEDEFGQHRMTCKREWGSVE